MGKEGHSGKRSTANPTFFLVRRPGVISGGTIEDGLRDWFEKRGIDVDMGSISFCISSEM